MFSCELLCESDNLNKDNQLKDYLSFLVKQRDI